MFTKSNGAGVTRMGLVKTRVAALLTALVLALSVVMAGVGPAPAGFTPVAHADLGAGGGGAPGGWGNAQDFRGILYYVFDAPTHEGYPQGTGIASYEYMRAAAASYYGLRIPTHDWDDGWMRGICQTAINEAEAATPGDDPGRVIGLFWASTYLNPGGSSITYSAYRSDWEDAYNGVNWAASVDYSNYTDEAVTEAKVREDVHRLLFREVDGMIHSGENPSFVCVATVEPTNGEIPDPKYDLNITTDSSVTGTLPYGSTRGISDLIHASVSGANPDPTVEATVVMNYDTASDGLVSVFKTVTIATQGDTRSPEFTPADFGLTEWMPARYWFDVGVAEQGRMSGPVDTPDRDPRETFTVPPCGKDCLTKELMVPGTTTVVDNQVLAAGQSYDARIEASSDGYTTQMFIRDTIFTDQVNIGDPASDDTSKVKLLGPDGAEHPVNVSVDRSQAGKVLVTGTFTPAKQGIFTLIVPTFALPNLVEYVIVDEPSWCGGNNLSVCFEGDAEEITKETPDPDKAWVLDRASGELVEDRQWSNAVGVDDMVFMPGSAVGVVVNGSVPKNLIEPLTLYRLKDDWSNGLAYLDLAQTAVVLFNGVDRTSDFTITTVNGVTTATAKPAFLADTAGLVRDAQVKLILGGHFLDGYTTNGKQKIVNKAFETWNTETQETNTPWVWTRTPDPNKAWVLDMVMGQATNDPNKTNNVGADRRVFLPNDVVGVVVNGVVPADMAAPASAYKLVDDWTRSATYVDFNHPELVKVWWKPDNTGAWIDVTGQFTITVDPARHTTTATAKPEWLALTAGHGDDSPVKLYVGGKFRTDYDTHGATVQLWNEGSETWNNTTVKTNVPWVFTWTPDPHKEVVGSALQAGTHTGDNIDRMRVYPGQFLEYSVQVDLRVPDNQAYGVKSLAVKDVYDEFFLLDKTSIEFWDTRTQRVLPASAYTLTFDDANKTFTAIFTPEWLAANMDPARPQDWGTNGWLILRFTGKVDPKIAVGTVVENTAYEVLNGRETQTETPEINVPPVSPDKEDLNTSLVDIDGKTVVMGDTILYRLTLDGGAPANQLAYYVHKLGMIDDFDETYLSLDAAQVRVLTQGTNADVTAKFNIQVKNGVLYVFAKQVDFTNRFGEVIPGDPQPADLEAYSRASIDPLRSPIIDQSLLGKKYWIMMPTKVLQETDGYIIRNRAVQNIENTMISTRIVYNPLKDIDPDKDVVVSEATNDVSINGAVVKLGSLFNYKIDSSVIPANRAYNASTWTMQDQFDRAHDYYTGMWAIYAASDLYEGTKKVFSKGDLLVDAAGHESEVYGGMFDVVWDESTYTMTVTAKAPYLDLVNSRGDLAQQWTLYVQMQRVAAAAKVDNQATESYNGVDRWTPVVTTNTPGHPGIDVEKYTLGEGWKQGGRGDHDTVDDAYTLSTAGKKGTDGWYHSAPVLVGYMLTNTGDVPLDVIRLTDVIALGTSGSFDDPSTEDVNEADQPLMCTVPAGSDGWEQVRAPSGGMMWVVPEPGQVPDSVDGVDSLENTVPISSLTLDIGQVVYCQVAVYNVEPATLHTDTVKVVATPVWPLGGDPRPDPGCVLSIDTDGDGIPDAYPDFDGDGFPDKTMEGCPVPPPSDCSYTVDTDGDGVPDHYADFDGDGFPDATMPGCLADVVWDSDDWHAVLPGTPGIDLVKFTLSEGVDKGDRDTMREAYVLSDDEMENGVKVGFLITNTGNSTLDAVRLGDVTENATTGTVTGIACSGALPAGEWADGYTLDRTASGVGALPAGWQAVCVGTLTGVGLGSTHEDLGTVTGTQPSVGRYPLEIVKATDPWAAKAPVAVVTGGSVMPASTKTIAAGSLVVALLLSGGVFAAAYLGRRNKPTTGK